MRGWQVPSDATSITCAAVAGLQLAAYELASVGRATKSNDEVVAATLDFEHMLDFTAAL